MKQKKEDYILMGLFCGCFVCEVLPHHSSQKYFCSVYIYLFMVSVKSLIGNKKCYHQSQFSCILFAVMVTQDY